MTASRGSDSQPRGTKGVASTRLALTARAALYATAFVLIWAWVAATVRPLDGRLGGPLPPWVQLPGLLLSFLGATLALWCVALFVWTGGGTPAPFDPPRTFVAVGPYRWVRNPMYLGAAGVLAGAGFALRSPAVTLLALVALGVAHLFVVGYEEPALSRRFGASYRDYQRRVPRWLPRRWSTETERTKL